MEINQILSSKILLVACLFMSLKVNAQEWGFSLNNGLAQHKEELLQQAVYRGYVLGIGADYKLKLKNESSFIADLKISGIYTSKTNLGNDLSQVNVNLELGYLFNTKKKYWKPGVSLQSQYNYTLYSLNYEYPFWITQYSINWVNTFNFDMKEKYNLSVSGSMPILGLLSRTPQEVFYEFKEDYTKAYFHRDMNFAFLNHFKALTTTVLFSKKE